MTRRRDVFRGGVVMDPDDPTVPYSQQYRAVLDWLGEALKASGRDDLNPREELHVLLAEVWDQGARENRADLLNPYYLGKTQ